MKRPATDRRVVYANSTTSIVVGDNGWAVSMIKGEPWDGDDPAVKSRPDLFTTFPPVRTSTGWVQWAD